ncbi:maleylpyruvate isomerase family mycothiol-dependent enzyme [Tessaracoccus sp. OS52]|uniref:maleylpyruvate isomerase family mycothiol-dependent enzyme n=1 Tax=Tessaracoccus sp. OS52 TaxID=2886691 RepID=UPI001D11591E|nr:maleylpyruvate isomerase family mycothiol-dependent enzyme [Tessaracoccus sp. OS52]MCC2591853.1 maleylpyruvate isomerase family mycothiol-dependent enzyme [Tessaracoccus sp. OS52]
MKMSAAEVWRVVHEERRRLASDLAEVAPERWRTPSLCPGWDVHDVVAHLVDTAKTGRVGFLRSMVAARGDFDRANEHGIAREKAPDAYSTLQALDEVTDLRLTPPANLATRLVEAIVHGEDIRRPLGIESSYPDDAVAEALDYQLRTPVGFGGPRERASGLRLVDTESGRSWGAGTEVQGRAIDLLLAVSGRPVEASRLAGPGSIHPSASLHHSARRRIRPRVEGPTPTPSPDKFWALVHAERAALADDLEQLTETQWHHPTLCGEWDVEDVVAHLIAAASLGRWQWLRSMLAVGFRPDVHNQRRLAEHRGSTPAETLGRFRAVVGNTVAPTADIAAFLGEVVVHAQDIRRPLGLDRTPSLAATTAVADFFVRRDFAVNSRTLARGLLLRADDGPFESGAGPVVAGSTLALVMAMAGRPTYIDDLDGPGREILQERISGP